VLGDFRKLSGKPMKMENAEDKDHGFDHEMAAKEMPVGKDQGAVAGQEGDEKQMASGEDMAQHMAHCEEMGKHLAAGNLDDAKMCYGKMMKHMAECGMGAMKHMSDGMEMSDVKSEDYKMSMDNLQGQVDELNTQMGRLAGMVDEMMGVEKDEAHMAQSEEEKMKMEIEKNIEGKA
jgi:hypothetical protein